MGSCMGDHVMRAFPQVSWAAALWNASLNQNLLHPDVAPVARDVEARAIAWLAPHFGMDGKLPGLRTQGVRRGPTGPLGTPSRTPRNLSRQGKCSRTGEKRSRASASTLGST